MNSGSTKTIALRSKKKASYEKFLPFAVSAVVALGLADLAVIFSREFMLPIQVPQSGLPPAANLPMASRSQYTSVVARNIFNENGIMPDPVGKGYDRFKGQDQTPVPSQLPLGLMGTVVHSNPSKSIANIEIRGKNQVISYTPNRDIDRIATLITVERNKAIIRNSNNGRLEFLENKETSKLTFQAATPTRLQGPADVRQTGDNQFEIPRSEILRHTQDMSALVMQASSVPHRKANGEIDGYTITSIAPGSVLTQLGILPQDTIKSVNGENIDSPAKAIELYNTLKNSSQVRITVERDGRDMQNEYKFTE